MKSILKELTEELSEAFVKAGYESHYGKVTMSNRLDIADYQCNGALVAAGQYKKAPYLIAEDVAVILKEKYYVEVVKPGFINIKLDDEYLGELVNTMAKDDHLGVEVMVQQSVIIDYGGPNIAKPLHVGHLRSAIIGESIKRIYKFLGHDIVGDIHLGDWGLQIGLVIEELKRMYPDLCYFDDEFEGIYPKDAPFTIDQLSEIYPLASMKSKKDKSYLEAARENTVKLQNNHKGYQAIWQHISTVSIKDLKKNYANLNVYFELWNGESHCMSKIPEVIDILTQKKLMHEDNGAMIVDVSVTEDKRPMPPFIALKSDGAALYSTTDLTTIYQRVNGKPLSEIIYVVDKRQELHFEQVFRCARKADIVTDEISLNFIGCGTMNGKDGKPFKTRDGGIMKLDDLVQLLRQSVKNKIFQGRDDYEDDLIDDIAIKVGLAALKYGDLINISTKDYIFDLDRFATFEGKTGPYILYSIVRIKSILAKSEEFTHEIDFAVTKTERMIHLKLLSFDSMIHQAYYDKAPNKICEYAFELSNMFNRFYHETKILADNNCHRDSHLTLLNLIMDVLEKCLDLLGIDSLDKM